MANGDKATTAFIHDDAYKRLNEGAHPRVPPRLSPPAVNWHVAFWDNDNRLIHDLADLVVAMVNSGDTVLVNLNGRQLNMTQDGLVPADGHEVLGFPITFTGAGGALQRTGRTRAAENPFRLETCNVALLWGTQLVKIAIAMHREFATMTVWLPAFHAKGAQAADAPPDEGIAPTLRSHLAGAMAIILASVDAAETAGLDFAARLATAPPPQSPDGKAYSLFLYEQVWRQFSEHYLKDFVAARPGRLTVFADFRSIILPAKFPHNQRDVLATEPKADYGATFDAGDSGRIAKAMGKFLETESGTRAELTGSSFLNHRVLYLSSLGSPAMDERHAGVARSARYVMVAHPMWRWQLGRLVERLNTLGTYRLAALRDLAALNEASRSLKSVGEALDKVQRDGIPDIAQRREDYRQLLNDFTDLGKADVSGGLAYRIELSRNYVKAFARMMPDLRIKRIEGYQPYDEFIARRYAGVWDRINRLGVRYQRLAQRMDYLDSRLATAEQAEQTEALQKQADAQVDLLRTQTVQTEALQRQADAQVELLTTQTVQTDALQRQADAQVKLLRTQAAQTEALKLQANTQVELLRAAEVVGAVAFAYYGGNILADILDIFTGWHAGKHGGGTAMLMLALYLVWLAWREKHGGDAGEPMPDGKKTFLLRAGAVAAVLAGGWMIWRDTQHANDAAPRIAAVVVDQPSLPADSPPISATPDAAPPARPLTPKPEPATKAP